MAFSLQGFHKQRMPFVLRLLRCVLPFPCSQVMEVIGQHLVASAFLLSASLLRGWRSYLGSDGRLFPCVIGNGEIVRQLHSGFLAGQSEQAGNKINCISVRLASETMETLVHLHAGILVIVKRADCHAVTVDLNAVHLRRLSGGDIAFYCFKYIHCIILSGNKKAPDIFTMKTASALQFHILFFVLCGFPLRLLLPLSRIVLQSLGYGVLRFGLLLNRLFRRKDFADPIANILHRLQFLSDGGKLPGKLGMGAFQTIVIKIPSILSLGLICRLTIDTERSNSSKPFAER